MITVRHILSFFLLSASEWIENSKKKQISKPKKSRKGKDTEIIFF